MTGKEKFLQDYPEYKRLDDKVMLKEILSTWAIRSCAYCAFYVTKKCKNVKSCKKGVRKYLKSEVKE